MIEINGGKLVNMAKKNLYHRMMFTTKKYTDVIHMTYPQYLCESMID